jgi:hypothetical protein
MNVKVGVGGRRREMHAGFWLGRLGERHEVEDLGLDERIILKWILKK